MTKLYKLRFLKNNCWDYLCTVSTWFASVSPVWRFNLSLLHALYTSVHWSMQRYHENVALVTSYIINARDWQRPIDISHCTLLNPGLTFLFSYLRCHCHWLDEQQATLHSFSRVLPVIINNIAAYVFRSAKIGEQLITAVQAGIAIFFINLVADLLLAI